MPDYFAIAVEQARRAFLDPLLADDVPAHWLCPFCGEGMAFDFQQKRVTCACTDPQQQTPTDEERS